MVAIDRTRSSLIDRAKHGDTDEFARLYAPFAFGVARKQGLDENDALDVMQETMQALLKLLPKFVYDRSRGTFRGLIKKIVQNRIVDQARRRKVAKVAGADDELSVVPDPSPGVELLYEKEWHKAILQLALDRVRKEVRPLTFQAFQLTVLEDWPVAKTAETLGVPENHVSQYKGRVVRKLREHLDALMREEE